MSITVFPEPILNKGTGQTPGMVTVTDVNTEILPPNDSRAFATLVNIGNNDVAVSYDVDAVFGEGLPLGRNGGFITLDADAYTEGPVNGICRPGKSSTISFQDADRS